jgi:hypothetical protein
MVPVVIYWNNTLPYQADAFLGGMGLLLQLRVQS